MREPTHSLPQIISLQLTWVCAQTPVRLLSSWKGPFCTSMLSIWFASVFNWAHMKRSESCLRVERFTLSVLRRMAEALCPCRRPCPESATATASWKCRSRRSLCWRGPGGAWTKLGKLNFACCGCWHMFAYRRQDLPFQFKVHYLFSKWF